MTRDTVIGGFVQANKKMLKTRVSRQMSLLHNVLFPRVPTATADALDSEVGAVN